MMVVYLVVAALVGVAFTYLAISLRANSVLNKTRSKLSQVKEEIKNKREEVEREIKNKEREFGLKKREELQELKGNFEKETKEKSREHNELSQRLMVREESLERQVVEIEKGKENLTAEKQRLEKEKEEIKTLGIKQKEELERIAGLSAEEAKNKLLETVKKASKKEATQIIRKIEQEAKEVGEEKAREIVAIAVQRCAVEEAGEISSSVVPLPNEEMKGRIIGREGRNITAFQTLTGVDLLVSDTLGEVVISCFDPLRRRVAEISLKQLIADGRIHPGRIEDVVGEAKKDVEKIVRQEGQHAAFEMGVSDLHSELVDLLGRLKFRTSYGQNVLQHSVEVANLAGMMAAEMKTDVARAKRAGLLHDIGKVSQETNGSHALDGAELAKRCGESSEIVHAIEVHHEDEQPIDTVLASLIKTADAISASRPGARREVLEKYLKRLKEMEEVALSFEGVDKAYAIRAGKELRVIVFSDKIGDEEIEALSGEIARRIEKELSYPGQIKVTVIRELRSTDYAK